MHNDRFSSFWKVAHTHTYTSLYYPTPTHLVHICHVSDVCHSFAHYILISLCFDCYLELRVRARHIDGMYCSCVFFFFQIKYDKNQVICVFYFWWNVLFRKLIRKGIKIDSFFSFFWPLFPGKWNSKNKMQGESCRSGTVAFNALRCVSRASEFYICYRT